MTESVRPWVDGGRRVASMRNDLGWTQQELADRIGISRAALSHLEAGLSLPGERTVALMAGIFKVEPHELVAGTGYPVGKAERLPVVVARYTEVEHQLLVLELDLERGLTAAEREGWRDRLRVLAKGAHDGRERAAIASALASLLER